MLVSRHPLSSLAWGVLVEIPLEEIDKKPWKYQRPIGLIGLLFTGIALVIWNYDRCALQATGGKQRARPTDSNDIS